MVKMGWSTPDTDEELPRDRLLIPKGTFLAAMLRRQ